MGTSTLSKNWYVAYTFPNAEKSVHKNLEKLQITSFLPLHETIRNWRDRKKRILTPLFPSYIFIHSSNSERFHALQVKGIVKYVSFDGKPAIIKDEQIESIKKIITEDVEVHHRESFVRGNRVTIIQGPLTGVEGVLERVYGKMRLVVQINCLNRAISVNISANMVSPLLNIACV